MVLKKIENLLFLYSGLINKVSDIKVGHTRFLPTLANRAVNFGAIFMKIGMYVYLDMQKNDIEKIYKICPFFSHILKIICPSINSLSIH